MSLAALLLNVAYIAWVGSAFTRRLALLRLLLIAGSAAAVVFGFLEEIWEMVGWNTLIIVLHLARIIGEQRAQHAVKLTAEESDLRDELFPDLNDYDFNLLWAMGETTRFDSEVMIANGSQPETVSVLLDGVVAITKSGDTKLGLRRGALIGEMSFVSGSPAQVDVVARGVVTVRQWDQRQLTSLDQANPPSAKAFRELISRDLTKKANAPLL